MEVPIPYSFSHIDLVEALIKAKGLHEGRWALRVNFTVVPGNFPAGQEGVSPAILVAVAGFELHRVAVGEAAPSGLVLDAAICNPLQQEETGAAGRSGLVN